MGSPTQKDFSDWLSGDRDFRSGLLMVIRTGINPADFKILQAGPRLETQILLEKIIQRRIGPKVEKNVPGELQASYKQKAIKSDEQVSSALTVELYRELMTKRNRLHVKLHYYRNKPESEQEALKSKIEGIQNEILQINQKIKPGNG